MSTSTSDLPTDPRRAAALRAHLDRIGPGLVPGWVGAREPGTFGRALVEIAARLAEETTRRLDLTAERDALAFFDALDIPPGAPQAATATVVLTLEESRTVPVSAPARLQIGAQVEGEEIIYETHGAVQLSPARLAIVVAVDPMTDHIEVAPARTVSLEPPETPVAGYRTVSFADTASTTLQLNPSIGLAAGGLLRIGTTVHRIAGVDQDLVSLIDPLESAIAAGTPVIEIEALEAFQLRNQQLHEFYVGHEDLLNLEQPARIEVHLSPDGLAQRLARLDLRFALWGTKADQDDPDWHELGRLGSTGSALQLTKAWHGSVDPREVGTTESRWLRVSLPGPIEGRAEVGARASRIGLKVASEAGQGASLDQAAGTVTHAFHNGSPLAVTDRFLPFGPEPQRFDIFALAAPEALSKAGAKVELDIRKVDASFVAFEPPVNALPDHLGFHVYGIGANGYLQSISLTTEPEVPWRELPNPQPEGEPVRLLDGDEGLLVAKGRPVWFLPSEIVVARDTTGGLWATALLYGVFSLGPWHAIDIADDTSLGDMVLVPAAATETEYSVRLFWIRNGALRTMALSSSGEPVTAWTELSVGRGAAPDLSSPASMGAIQRPGQPPTAISQLDLVLSDAGGDVWYGAVTPDPLTVRWKRLTTSPGAVPGVRPAASHYTQPGGATRLWVAWAESSGGLGAWNGPISGPTATDDGDLVAASSARGFTTRVGTAVRVLPQSWDDSATQPLTVAVGDADPGLSVLVWSGRDRRHVAPIPAPPADLVTPDVAIVHLGGGGDDDDGAFGAQLIVPAAGESLALATIGHARRQVTFQARDGLTIDGVATASNFVELVEGASEQIVELGPARILRGDTRVYEIGGGILQPGQSWRAFNRLGAVKTGELRTDKSQVVLDGNDNATADGRHLRIADELYKVATIVEEADPGGGDPLRIANLDREVDGTAGSITYMTAAETGSGQVVEADRQTLLRLSVVADTDELSTIVFPDGVPIEQAIPANLVSSSKNWVRLTLGWTILPATNDALVQGQLSVTGWTTRVLDRGYRNPELSWEFFDGDGWRRLEEEFVDSTGHLATSGRVSFRVPDSLSITEIGGREDHWIRARLVGGDYGRPRYQIKTSPPDGAGTVTQLTEVDTSQLHPPEITSIVASFELDEVVAPQSVLVANNLATLDQTQASAVDQARFELFEGALAIDHEASGRAVYVGLTRQPAVNPLTLYAIADDQEGSGPLQVDMLGRSGWHRVTVDDRTESLRRRGLVQVFLNAPLVRERLFGIEGFWLRLRPERDADGGWAPVVRGLYLNAAAADHAKTIEQEILGSSLGEPGMVVELSEPPILPDTLELRVREQLSEDELDNLEKERRQLVRLSGRAESETPTVIERTDLAEGEWVLWRRADSFVGLDGDARVYRLDPATARITFGDGRQGKIPPAGRDAIRAFVYQHGGGRKGNAPGWTALSVKSGVEGVETALLPAEAAGGVDAPSPSTLTATAPARLRHAGQALTVDDFEALAVAYSPEIVRARCLPPAGAGQPIRVVIAQRDGTRCPVPSLAQREAVGRSLLQAGWGGLGADAVRVAPPRYVMLAVTVGLRAAASAAAQVEQRAGSVLTEFLHPIDGGPDGEGWPFGRQLWVSDVLRALAGVNGIDRFDGVEITLDDGTPVGDIPDDALICAEAANIDIQVRPVEER